MKTLSHITYKLGKARGVLIGFIAGAAVIGMLGFLAGRYFAENENILKHLANIYDEILFLKRNLVR